MRYLCAVYVEPTTMEKLSPAEGATLDRDSNAYDEELRRSGHYIASAALQLVNHGQNPARPQRKIVHHGRSLRRDQGAVGRLHPGGSRGHGRGRRASLEDPDGKTRHHRGTPRHGAIVEASILTWRRDSWQSDRRRTAALRRSLLKHGLNFFPSPDGRGFKERDLTQRTIFFGRDSRFRSGTMVCKSPRSKRSRRTRFRHRGGILNRARETARWIRSLTFNPLPTGEGKSVAPRYAASSAEPQTLHFAGFAPFAD